MSEAIGLYQCATNEQFMYLMDLWQEIVTREGSTFYVNAVKNLIAWVYHEEHNVWCSYPVRGSVS